MEKDHVLYAGIIQIVRVISVYLLLCESERGTVKLMSLVTHFSSILFKFIDNYDIKRNLLKYNFLFNRIALKKFLSSLH